MVSYAINKSGRVADVDCGVMVGPHLNPLPYSPFDNYASFHKVSTYHVNVERELKDPDIMYWNPNANTGSMDIWQQGLSFKTVVPQNESYWCKNPWFFSNGEARTWVGGAPDTTNPAEVMSTDKNGRHAPDRLGSSNRYSQNVSNVVDRFFA